MKYIFTALVLLRITGLGTAQVGFEHDYRPIGNKTAFPDAYFGKMQERVDALAASQEILSKKDAANLYLQAGLHLRALFENGYILYDNPLTDYVREVAARTFAGQPAALNGITFYVTTLYEANAVSFAEGTILVNIGLLDVLDNEAQLAFILAHEVAHFNKKHALRAYKQWEMLKNKKGDTEKEKLTFLGLFHSREYETEADGYSLSIMAASPYDALQSAFALANIEKEDTALVPARKDLSALLNSDYFKLDSALLNVNQKFRSADGRTVRSKHSIFKGDPDNLSSHPAIDKRKIAVDEILRSTDYLATDKKLDMDEARFREMQTLALFESADHAYEDKNFFMSLAIAGELLKRFPENAFLHTLVLKSIYWTAYYKDVNELNHLEMDLPVYNRARYWLIAKVISKTESGGIKKMAYAYAKKMQKFMEKDDEFSFYLALAMEQYLGKEAAGIFYAQYRNKFPAGKHIAFVNEKTEQP